MKVEVQLNVTQQEFYDYLIQSLILDIFKQTDEFFLKENLHEGFIYQKKIKDKQAKIYEATVEILKLEEPIIYQSQITIGSNKNQISYECQSINHQVNVIYDETYSSSKKLLDWNHKLMSFILGKSYKKKIKQMLMNMETHIQRSKV